MPATFQQIDTWVEDNGSKARKAFVDDQGRPLTGRVMHETKNNRVVTFCKCGHRAATYGFPKDVAAPESALLSWDNTALCGEFRIKEGKHADHVIEAVFGGMKPVGECAPGNKGEVAKQARERGFQVSDEYTSMDQHGNSRYVVMVGINNPLGELFDLGAIANYYAATTGSGDAIRAALSAAANKTPMAVLRGINFAAPRTDVECALTGLCFGYALESTVSFMREVAARAQKQAA